MLRSVLAIFGGLMAGFWLILGITKLGNRFYPPPTWLDYSKPETIERTIRETPTGMLMFLLLAWGVGTFISAGIAARIAPSWKIGHGMIIGGLFLFNSLGQTAALPYPLWFKIAGPALFLPMAYLGARLVTLAPTEKPATFEE
jgi:hypothetical protein